MIHSVNFLLRFNQIRQHLLNSVNTFLDCSFEDLYPDILNIHLSDRQKVIACATDFFYILNLVCDVLIEAELENYNPILLRVFLRNLDITRYELLSELVHETGVNYVVENVNLFNCSNSELQESVITILYDIAEMFCTSLKNT